MFIWFNPPIAPATADNTLAVIANLKFIEQIKIKGAIFCHENKSIHWNQFKYILTWGNQKWKGANPAFIKRAEVKIISRFSKFKYSWFKNLKFTPKINKIDAIAWVKKYLIEASVSLEFNFESIRGIILIKLISNPSHLVNQELEDTAITVPVIKIEINIRW